MKVSEIMTREPARVPPEATLGEVATLMKHPQHFRRALRTSRIRVGQ
jgi:CBS domain-containing protein